MKPSFLFDNTNTFCISLKSSTDRWRKMEDQFKKVGLHSVTRWTASEPLNLTDTFFGYLNPLQCACAQSHINIYKHMIEHNIDYALIMEDDTRFDKEWTVKLQRFYDQIGPIDEQNQWEAIFLNSSEPEYEVNKWNVCKEQYLTGAYVLHISGAKCILSRFLNCYGSSDWMTSRLQENGKCYTYYPWLVIQEGKESLIGSGVEADHAKVVRCLGEINYSLDHYYMETEVITQIN